MPANAPAPAAPEPVALDAAGFDRCMAALGPFEPEPHLALAVSGGADSLALMILASHWLGARGGRGTVLTVDHRLRAAAAREAAWVAAIAARLGLAHRTLPWQHDGHRASAAAARAARYRLLDEACRELGCLHLLLAHHAGDQAVTRAMRAERRWGLGLAGMPAVRELDHCRLLRPLLSVPRARLQATAARFGWGWIEDPSNRDPSAERNRTAPTALPDGLVAARSELEQRATRALVRLAHIDPLGAVTLDALGFARLDAEAAGLVLQRITASIGGRRYPPSLARARTLAGEIQAGRRRTTLAGTLIERTGDLLHVRREWQHLRCTRVAPGASTLVDGRFRVTNSNHQPLDVAALGAAAAQGQAKPSRQDWRVLASLPTACDVLRNGSWNLLWTPRYALAPAPFAAGLVVSRFDLPT
ncbi:MAG: tRNA lysidine(34) synthetase TilS [Geminicoccaceae bacterium]|nr:MAG: tRNA lysidine(34) synthetase TilS [Geminicoccaceae bacterium]